MFVHAHPDDETIGTGATMAQYAADGAHVTLITCTLGEEGEIHVPELAQLEAAQADQLGGYRIGELFASCRALGVTDHRFLGGAGRFRDSGMMGLPANENPRAFWGADLDEAAKLLLPIIDEIRPQVIVTYDENGFYGHPDHIQAHRVAMRAAEMATEAGFGPQKIYWTAVPRSVLAAGTGCVRRVDREPVRRCEEHRGPSVRYARRADRGAHRRARPAREEARLDPGACDPDPDDILAVRDRRQLRRGVHGCRVLHARGRRARPGRRPERLGK